MPRGNGTGPPWGSSFSAGRRLGRCLKQSDSKVSGGRTQRYVQFVEILVPVVAALLKLFKKPKNPG